MSQPLLWAGALGSLLAPTAVALPGAVVGVEYLTVDEALAVHFPQADRFAKEVVIPPKGLELRKRKTPTHYFRYEAWAGDELVGFAVVDDVLGKSRPITYMLATTPDAEVVGIEILAYRESHGHEVGREAFRDQFKGRDVDSTLRLGGDIRNISGATISCRSITAGVADLLALLDATPKVVVEAEAPATVLEPAPPASLPCGAEAVCRARVLMNAPLGIAVRLAGATDAERGTARAAALQHMERAYAEVARLEARLSAFAEQGDPARVARAAGGEPVEVAPETLALLRRALEVADKTGGAVTPLAGPLVRLYREADAPHEAALSAAVQLTRPSLVQLGPGTVRLARAGMGLDFGASGKGFALDAAAAQLVEQDAATSALLDFGGQLLVAGPAPAGGYPVELADGTPLALTAGSLATSSDAERGAHVFDARTGKPVASHGAVTVWAQSALDADLWSSALWVLGEKQGLALAKAEGIAAHFAPRESGAPAQVTPAWSARFPAR